MFTIRKLIGELGDKIDGSEKADIEAAIAGLKTALENEDADAIEAAIETVTQRATHLRKNSYQANAGQAPEGAALDAS